MSRAEGATRRNAALTSTPFTAVWAYRLHLIVPGNGLEQAIQVIGSYDRLQKRSITITSLSSGLLRFVAWAPKELTNFLTLRSYS